MAIKYFPNRLEHNRLGSNIDRTRALRNPLMSMSHSNCASVATSFIVSQDYGWMVDNITLKYSNNTASRTYALNIKNGRKVVSKMNNDLWFTGNTVAPQRIILASGFYTGTQLAAELKSKLDANTRFTDDGYTPFAVAYDNVVGTFTVTPNAGTIRYLSVNTQAVLNIRDSIAGHLFGFEATTTNSSASVTSDTVHPGLDNEIAFFSEAAATTQDVFYDDLVTMSIDQAVEVQIDQAAAALTCDIQIVSERIV